ncbi:hypothetical protein TGME49_270750 [Toxoplasma gondii ME49]|uniref:Uncharacterized protein n=2 Tax=Toxoplasma gondii TaxID=5811 RepID=S8GIW8_TOXGM|nr:hypothetical protein TGME49_270750 [Toxoplasma gondii ME49]EPT28444.1 hypothetical protein TGME49_270750 [Toxoplasma gondii ME49]|eukprot:XP_002365741.1 hypothetical protein TGME49_270750 [Toxoplasma gondii ME49]
MGPGSGQVSLSPVLAPRVRLRSTQGDACECEAVSLGALSPSSHRQLLSAFAVVFPAECTPRNSAAANAATKRGTSPLARLSCSSPGFLSVSTPSALRPAPLCRPARLASPRLTPPRSPVSAPEAAPEAAARAAAVAAALGGPPRVSGTETPRGHKSSSCLSPLLASPGAPKTRRRRLVLAETQTRASFSPVRDDASGASTPLHSPSPPPAAGSSTGLHPDFFLHLHQWRSLPGPVSPVPKRPAEERRTVAATNSGSARDPEGVWRRWGRMEAGRLQSETDAIPGEDRLGAASRGRRGKAAVEPREQSCLGRRRIRDDAVEAAENPVEMPEIPRKQLRTARGREDAHPLKATAAQMPSLEAERLETEQGDKGTKVTLLLSVPLWYSLANAVCSYGFFCMCPNRWTPETPPLCAASSPSASPATAPSSLELTAARVETDSTDRSRTAFDSSAVSDGRRSARASEATPAGGPRSGAQRGRRGQETVPASASPGGAATAPEEVRLAGSFSRPLRFGPLMEKSCEVSLRMQEAGKLRLEIAAGALLQPEDEAEILHQVRRMCRLQVEDWAHVQAFWKMHERAASRGFGLLFRSPTLWEDIVKTVTICNVRWRQSCVMNDLFCRRISSIPGSFPSPLDFLRFKAEDLSRVAGVGYRADRLLRLAHRVVDGSLDLAALDQGPPAPVSGDACLRPSPSAVTSTSSSTTSSFTPSAPDGDPRHVSPPSQGAAAVGGRRRRPGSTREEPPETVAKETLAPAAACEDPEERRRLRKEWTLKALLGIHGVGSFAAENILQLLGFTEVDAFDSETVRHMGEVHGVKSAKVKDVLDHARARFAAYRPYQFLAYWHELWECYEAKTGGRSDVWTAQTSAFLLQDERHLKPPAVTADAALPAYFFAPENTPENLLKQIRNGGLPFMAEPPSKRLSPAVLSGVQTPVAQQQTRRPRRGGKAEESREAGKDSEVERSSPSRATRARRSREGTKQTEGVRKRRGVKAENGMETRSKSLRGRAKRLSQTCP